MSEPKSKGGLDPELVRELAHILRDTGLTEIEVEHGDLKLRVARTAVAAAAPALAYAPAPAPAPLAEPPSPVAETIDYKTHPGAVLSPMVGTAYLAPEPGKPAFVTRGQMVAQGEPLVIVEAMKTFNPIPAPRAGKVAAVLVADGQPVEYGEPLVILE